MGASLRSSGSGFAAFAKKLDRLADKYPALAGEKAADAAQKCLDKEYADEAGPDGAQWKAKKRPNGKPRGEASGDTKDSAKATPGPNAEVLLVVEGASDFLQGGTVHMDARPIIPTGKLPAQWAEPIDKAAEEAIHEAYGAR